VLEQNCAGLFHKSKNTWR